MFVFGISNARVALLSLAIAVLVTAVSCVAFAAAPTLFAIAISFVVLILFSRIAAKRMKHAIETSTFRTPLGEMWALPQPNKQRRFSVTFNLMCFVLTWSCAMMFFTAGILVQFDHVDFAMGVGLNNLAVLFALNLAVLQFCERSDAPEAQDQQAK